MARDIVSKKQENSVNRPTLFSIIRKRINPSAEVELFGQDNNPWYSSIALAETIIRGQNPENIKLVESSLTEDAHEDQKMRLILMNPPFGESWSKEKIGAEQFKKINEEHSRTGGKYTAGLPQSGDMQMLFWQLIISKLANNEKEGSFGKAAVICNASPLFSGGSKSGESDIRKWLFEHDYVEAIVQFCPELFYNTGIPIYAFIFNMKKDKKREGKIQLINASGFSKRLTKGLGFKRNELTDTHIEEIIKIYREFDNPANKDIVRIFDKKDFYYKEVPSYQPFQRNFMIAPNRIENLYSASAYKKLYDEDDYQDLEDMPSKTALQIEKMHKLLEGKELQNKIINVLNSNISSKVYKNRDEFAKFILSLLPEIKDNKTLVKAIVLALSEDDDTADKYYDKKGRPEQDSDLKDSEIIPYKMDNTKYFEEEVKPFIDDAWLETDEDKITVGCEINFNKYFYVYTKPENSSDILERIKSLKAKEEELEEGLYGRK